MGDSGDEYFAEQEDLVREIVRDDAGQIKGFAWVRVQSWRKCPLCHEGQMVYPKVKGQDPVCYLCRGVGHVPLDVCWGCGRPAEYYKAGTLWCGTRECFEKIVPDATKEGEEATTTSRFGPFGVTWDVYC